MLLSVQKHAESQVEDICNDRFALWTPKSGERNLGVHVQVGTAVAQMIAEDFGDTNSPGRFVEESECTCKLF